MATVATLTFDLVAQSAKLRSELKKATKHTKSWADDTRKVVNASGKAFVGLTATGVAGMAAIYTQTAQAADSLGKFSDKLGEAPERIQGLQRAFELTGVSVETGNMALQRMTRRVAEAGQGTGEAVNALRELNLDAQNLAKLSPADQFEAISDAMKGVSNQGDRVRLAMKLFDSEGVSLVNTMALGSDGIRSATEEVKAYGLELTRVDIAKIEAANDSWFKSKEVLDGFGNQLATELAPVVSSLANEFLNVAKESGGMGQVATEALDWVLSGVGVLADGVRGIQIVWHGVKLVAAGALSTIIQMVARADTAVSEFLDWLPGISAAPSQALKQINEDLKASYDQISKDLETSLLEPIPSEKIKKYVSDAQSMATEAATKVAEAAKANISTPNTEISTFGEQEQQSQKLKSFKDLLTEYEVASKNTAGSIENSLVSAFDNTANSVSDMVATTVIEGGNMREAFGNVAKTIAVDLVSSLVKVGVQMAVNSAFSKASAAESVTTAAATGPAIAGAYAPAAAMSTLATGGTNSVAAAAAIAGTVGLALGYAATGMAHDGIDAIPKEGTWLLDKGERVIPSAQNEEIVAAVKNGTGGSKIEVTNVFQIQTGVAGTVQQEFRKLLPVIERVSVASVEQAIMNGGSLSRAIGVR